MELERSDNVHMTFSVRANFIDVFKIGDNINYNLGILRALYDIFDSSTDSRKLIKPIVIINTSITEAILFDFIVNRLKRPYRTEIIFADIFAALQNKDLHKFEHYITQAEKYDLFDLKGTNFYEAMSKLGKIRNRIHIQNEKWDEPHSEYELFNEDAKILSEKVLEKLLNIMTTKYQRREEYHNYVSDFQLPWDRHFEEPSNASDLTLEEAQELGLI